MNIWVKNKLGNYTLDPENLPPTIPSEINTAFKKGFKVGTPEYKKCILDKAKNR